MYWWGSWWSNFVSTHDTGSNDRRNC